MLKRAVLTITVSLLAWHAASAPALAQTDVTYVGRFRFLPKSSVIMLPISGPLASLAWDKRPRMPVQKVDYLEIPGLGTTPARLQGRLVQSRNARKGLVRRILVAQNRPGVVRVAVRGSRAVHMVPDYTQRNGRWYLRIKIVPYKGH